MADKKTDSSKTNGHQLTEDILLYLFLIFAFMQMISGGNMNNLDSANQNLNANDPNKKEFSIFNFTKEKDPKVGDTIINKAKTQVRNSVAGSVIGSQDSGEKGKVFKGPVESFQKKWFRIDYEKTPDGWIDGSSVSTKTGLYGAKSLAKKAVDTVRIGLLWLGLLALVLFFLLTRKIKNLNKAKQEKKDLKKQSAVYKAGNVSKDSSKESSEKNVSDVSSVSNASSVNNQKSSEKNSSQAKSSEIKSSANYSSRANSSEIEKNENTSSKTKSFEKNVSQKESFSNKSVSQEESKKQNVSHEESKNVASSDSQKSNKNFSQNNYSAKSESQKDYSQKDYSSKTESQKNFSQNNYSSNAEISKDNYSRQNDSSKDFRQNFSDSKSRKENQEKSFDSKEQNYDSFAGSKNNYSNDNFKENSNFENKNQTKDINQSKNNFFVSFGNLFKKKEKDFDSKNYNNRETENGNDFRDSNNGKSKNNADQINNILFSNSKTENYKTDHVSNKINEKREFEERNDDFDVSDLPVPNLPIGDLNSNYFYSQNYSEKTTLPENEEVKKDRWQVILDLLESHSSLDWKKSIIQADLILEEMIEKMGYEGKNIEDKMKKIDTVDFITLDKAIEAHSIKNRISALNSEYILSKDEAIATIKLYEEVFKEFYYI